MKDKVSAIICAAGKGERAGFDKNKLLSPLLGAPALWHTLEKFNIKEIDEVIVTSSQTDFEEISLLCKPFGYKVVLGGATRTESVKRALNAVTGEIVLIHDGARPFVSKEIILSCIETVKKFGSAICAVSCTDTIVSGELGEIRERLDRNCVYRVQTPQGFMTADIKCAYELAGSKAYTDDSEVYGEYIAPPRLIEGSKQNIKLTYARDFDIGLPAFVSDGCPVGFGVDTHAVTGGDGITLGGVLIPCNMRLLAHSDGDVIIHALMDALLSAAGLKDIGHYFPVDDKNYDGADSKLLLEKVVKLLETEGYMAGNVSITVQAEKPKLSPYVDTMRQILGGILKTDKIAISAGTNEKLGYIGAGLGITAYAAVTLREVKNGENQ